LATCLDASIGGLAQDRHIGFEKTRLSFLDLKETTFASGDLFSCVEQPRDVVSWSHEVFRKIHHDRQRALHIRRAKTVQHISLSARHDARRWHGVEVASNNDSTISTKDGSRDHVVTDANYF
jgi:hypothetical protein